MEPKRTAEEIVQGLMGEGYSENHARLIALTDEEAEGKDAERCPHCCKLVPNVYQHTSQEECDVVNVQIADLIQNGVE